MLDNFLVAIGAVVPLFVLIGVGVIVKRMHLLTKLETEHVNRMVFKIFFFCMMFYNIYTTNLETSFRPYMLLFAGVTVLLEFVLAVVVVCFVEKDNRRRGAMIQALFRSNVVLMGIPLVGNIFGDDQLAIPSMIIAVTVPLYNVLAVFDLETFRGGKFNLGHILLNVLKNPMIMGAILAVILRVIGIEHLPQAILKPIGQVAAATTPVALIILGASIKGGSYHQHLRQLIGCVTGRLIIMPGIIIPVAIALGFRGIELVTLTAVFSTPCAVAGFAMAQQMGSDADLAGNCVVYSSAFSGFTIFGWIFVEKMLGLF